MEMISVRLLACLCSFSFFALWFVKLFLKLLLFLNFEQHFALKCDSILIHLHSIYVFICQYAGILQIIAIAHV